MKLDEEFVKTMDKFIDIFMEDREANKKVLIKTQECLSKINVQLAVMQKQTEIEARISEEKHKTIDNKLKNVSTEKEKDTIENRIISLEKLKPKFYMILGGLGLLAIIGIPIAKKMGWL